MRALVQTPGGPDALRPESVGDLGAAGGKVLVAVRAAGVCYPDLLATYGRYQLRRPDTPFIPGFEVAGVVVAP